MYLLLCNEGHCIGVISYHFGTDTQTYVIPLLAAECL